MLYRYTLGRKEDITQVIPDNTFLTGCGAGTWTCGAGWNIGVGDARYQAAYSITGGLLYNAGGVFTIGKRYKIKINLVAANPNVWLMVYCGDYSTWGKSTFCNTTTIEFEINCLGGTNFILRANAAIGTGVQIIDISSVEAYEMIWNNPLINQPESKTIKTFTKSELIKGCYVTFINDIDFFGDGYTYLNNLSISDFTQDVPVRIEYYYLGVWTDYFIGLIYLSEVKWMRDIARTSIEDNVISKLIRKKIDTTFNVFQNDGKSLTNHPLEMVYLHDPNTGVYDGSDPNMIYNVFRLLRILIHEATDLDVTLTSNLLTIGDFKYLALAKGWNCWVCQTGPGGQMDAGIDISVKELLENLNDVLNIGIIATTVSGVPALKVEKYSDLRDDTASFNLYNVVNWEYTYDTKYIPNDIKCGYLTSSVKTTRQDSSTHYISYDKIADGEMDVASRYIQDTVLIEQVVNSAAIGGETFVDDIFWIQYKWNGASFVSLKYVDIYPAVATPVPDWLYNPQIDADDNVTRHLTTLSLNYKNGSIDYPATGKLLKRIYPFEYPLTFAQLKILEGNPLQKLVITGANNLPEAYIEELEFDNVTQMAKFKVISQ